MIWRTWRDRQRAAERGDDRNHEHDRGVSSHRIDTGHGVIRLEIFEGDGPARFRIRQDDAHGHPQSARVVSVETERADGGHQTFLLDSKDGFLESIDDIPEPHEFIARVHLQHGDHMHDYDVEFTEPGHDHVVEGYDALDLTAPGYQDAHELAHADDIRRRFANRNVTSGQILMFGLTAGLIPCPAAITVLLLCLQLKQITLGAALVLCFSIGLALTLVLSGAVAAVSVRHVAKRWSGFGEVARNAPFFSGALILLMGLYVGYQGLHALV